MATTSSYHEPPTILKLLAHEVRWLLLRELVQSDCRVQELVERVNRPMNLISYHLKQLRTHHLVTERRSSADGRDVYYSADLPRLNELYQEGGSQLHPALGNVVDSQLAASVSTTGTPLRVLFLCTHNSARSQMAEGLLRALGGNAVDVYSAGNQPSVVHPYAIRAMAEVGIDISQQRSKHLDELRGQSFDLIITVCDRVREYCPIFPGDPECIHWSIRDPITTAQADDYPLFVAAAREIRTRITYLLLTLHNGERNAQRPSRLHATKPKVLFVCTNNAARSQMAEALLRKYAGHRYEIYSAGLEPTTIDPAVIQVMQEMGVDVAGQRAKPLFDYLGHVKFDYLFTVCARSERECPAALLKSGGEQVAWYFEDPVALTEAGETRIAKFREVRDKIGHQLREWLVTRQEIVLT